MLFYNFENQKKIFRKTIKYAALSWNDMYVYIYIFWLLNFQNGDLISRLKCFANWRKKRSTWYLRSIIIILSFFLNRGQYIFDKLNLL